MKRHLLVLIAFLLTSYNVIAQCNPAVPFNAVVVNSTQTINGGFDPIWVCSGDTLHSDGGFHNIFLEPGAVMTTGGGIDTIYVKESGFFSMNGGIHVIYYESISDLSINGGIPTQNFCADLTFNYINAPSNGCSLILLAALQSSDSTVCAGNCIDFFDLSNGATSWQWTFSGGAPSTSSDQNPENVCYDNPGTYDVSLLVSNTSGGDTLVLNDFITVYPAAATPVLTQNGDTLFSPNGYATYQWYFEGVLITGATDNFYIAPQNGEYSIEVTDSNGCPASASIQFIATVAFEDVIAQSGVSIFPNPASDYITINAHSSYLIFYDLHGRTLSRIDSPSPTHVKVDVSSFPLVFFVRNDKCQIIKVARLKP